MPTTYFVDDSAPAGGGGGGSGSAAPLVLGKEGQQGGDGAPRDGSEGAATTASSASAAAAAAEEEEDDEEEEEEEEEETGAVDQALRTVFLELDAKRDGKLSVKEIVAACAKGVDVNGDGTAEVDGSQFTPPLIASLVKAFDSNRDGTLGIPEFHALMTEGRQQPKPSGGGLSPKKAAAAAAAAAAADTHWVHLVDFRGFVLHLASSLTFEATMGAALTDAMGTFKLVPDATGTKGALVRRMVEIVDRAVLERAVAHMPTLNANLLRMHQHAVWMGTLSVDAQMMMDGTAARAAAAAAAAAGGADGGAAAAAGKSSASSRLDTCHPEGPVALASRSSSCPPGGRGPAKRREALVARRGAVLEALCSGGLYALAHFDQVNLAIAMHHVNLRSTARPFDGKVLLKRRRRSGQRQRQRRRQLHDDDGGGSGRKDDDDAAADDEDDDDDDDDDDDRAAGADSGGPLVPCPFLHEAKNSVHHDPTSAFGENYDNDRLVRVLHMLPAHTGSSYVQLISEMALEDNTRLAKITSAKHKAARAISTPSSQLARRRFLEELPDTALLPMLMAARGNERTGRPCAHFARFFPAAAAAAAASPAFPPPSFSGRVHEKAAAAAAAGAAAIVDSHTRKAASSVGFPHATLLSLLRPMTPGQRSAYLRQLLDAYGTVGLLAPY